MISAAPELPTIDYAKLEQSLKTAKDDHELFQRIVDAPFKQKSESGWLFLGLISLFLVDHTTKIVKLVAVSDTEHYNMSISGYNFSVSDYKLSLEKDQRNDIVKAINSNMPQATTDWESLSRLKADAEQARLNQANSGIAFSVTYPLNITNGGALLFCFFQYPENIGDDQRSFMKKYSQLVAKFF